jgi:tetratricopeptide (TPR) repeat protein
MLYLARRYEEAIAQLERTIDLSPGYWFAHLRLAQALMATGEYDRGIEVMQKAIELAGPGTQRSGKHMLASLYALAGNRAEAAKILREIEEQEKTTYVPPTDLAQIHAYLGNIDEAFAWLDEAVEVRDADLFMAKVSPVWDPIRRDPRFDELLHQLYLSDRDVTYAVTPQEQE